MWRIKTDPHFEVIGMNDKGARTMTSELYYAEMEAARNEVEKAYFDARPSLGTEVDHALFRSGFERGFQRLWGRVERLERELVEAREYIDSLPGNWRTDSSLATWFPITSEAFERTKMELAEARADMALFARNGVYARDGKHGGRQVVIQDRPAGPPAERASSEPTPCTCRDFPGAYQFCMAHTVRPADQPEGEG